MNRMQPPDHLKMTDFVHTLKDTFDREGILEVGFEKSFSAVLISGRSTLGEEELMEILFTNPNVDKEQSKIFALSGQKFRITAFKK